MRRSRDSMPLPGTRHWIQPVTPNQQLPHHRLRRNREQHQHLSPARRRNRIRQHRAIATRQANPRQSPPINSRCSGRSATAAPGHSILPLHKKFAQAKVLIMFSSLLLASFLRKPPLFIAWSHFACTPTRYQDFFSGDDADSVHD
jgi:hypothetical protein